jgi:Na+/proline symporter
MRVAGAALVLLGFLGLMFGGIPYKKTENIAQFGDLKMQVTEKKELALPPWISGVAILAGAAMLFVRRGPSNPS